MIIKSTKPIIGLEKMIIPYKILSPQNSKPYLICYKGYEPHYQWIINNCNQIGDQQLYFYDRCSVDLSFEMALRKTNKLSYFSTRNYQTVEAVKKDSGKQLDNDLFYKDIKEDYIQKVNLPITPQISQKCKYILKNYDFQIKNSFLDIHPLQAYQKICGYLMIKPEKTILNLFKKFTCNPDPLFNDFVLLPMLQEMRERFLITNQFKLKQLVRKQEIKITPEITQGYLRKWQQSINFKILSKSNNSITQTSKFQWAIDNKIGEIVSKKDAINGKYRHYFYATWP